MCETINKNEALGDLRPPLDSGVPIPAPKVFFWETYYCVEQLVTIVARLHKAIMGPTGVFVGQEMVPRDPRLQTNLYNGLALITQLLTCRSQATQVHAVTERCDQLPCRAWQGHHVSPRYITLRFLYRISTNTTFNKTKAQ